MANYSITIQNTTSLFGIVPTPKWDVHSWDQTYWDEVIEGLTHDIQKLIANNLTPATSYIFYITHVFGTDFNFDSAVALQVSKFISSDFSFTSDIDLQTLADPAGWNYVFIKPSIDADEQVITSFTELNATSTTWTSLSASSDVWS